MGRVENFVLGALGARRGHVGKIFWLLSRCVIGHKLLAESLGVAQGVSLSEGRFAHAPWVDTQKPVLCMGVIYGVFLWSALVILVSFSIAFLSQ